MVSPSNLLPKIFRNLGFASLAVLVSKVTQLLLFVLIARWLGAEGLGQYTYALSVVLLAGVLSDLGITQYLVSQVAATGEKSDWYLKHTFTLRLGLSISGLILVFLLGLFLNLSPESRILLYLLGVGQFLVNVTLGWRWIFQAKQKLQYETLLILIFGLVYSLSGLAFLSWQKKIIWIGLSYSFAGLAFFLVCYGIIRTRFTRVTQKFDFSAWRKILSGALPITLSIIFMSVYLNFDTILLTGFQGERASGLYNASNRIIQQTRLIPALLGPVFLPALSQLAAFDPAGLSTLLKRGLFYLFTLLLPVVVLVSFAADKIIFLLYGAGFSASAVVLQLQIWSALFMVLYMFVFNALMAEKRFQSLAILTGSGAVVNIALNLILIPQLSIKAPALALFSSEFLVLAGTIWVLQKQFGLGLGFLGKLLAAPSGAGLIMVSCWVFFSGWNWVILAILSSAVYFLALVLLKGIPTEEWRIWRGLLRLEKKSSWLEAKSET